MLYEFCGLDWLQLIDGCWGVCCSKHDIDGLSVPSNYEFLLCMLRVATSCIAVWLEPYLAGWLGGYAAQLAATIIGALLGVIVAILGFAAVTIGLIVKTAYRALRRYR